MSLQLFYSIIWNGSFPQEVSAGRLTEAKTVEEGGEECF